MTKKEFMNNLFDIISNNIEDINYKSGINLFLNEDDELFFELEEDKKIFVLKAEIMKED